MKFLLIDPNKFRVSILKSIVTGNKQYKVTITNRETGFQSSRYNVDPQLAVINLLSHLCDCNVLKPGLYINDI